MAFRLRSREGLYANLCNISALSQMRLERIHNAHHKNEKLQFRLKWEFQYEIIGKPTRRSKRKSDRQVNNETGLRTHHRVRSETQEQTPMWASKKKGFSRERSPSNADSGKDTSSRTNATKELTTNTSPPSRNRNARV